MFDYIFCHSSKDKVSRTKKQGRSSKKIPTKQSCPIGRHWVSSHVKHKTSSRGLAYVQPVSGHCRNSRGTKTTFTKIQIQEISKDPSFKSEKRPCSLKLRFDDGNSYDDLIAGWTDYWNKVFEPDVPLDSNLVKALIASESGFRKLLLANPENPLSARGLMQILDGTRVILGNRKGELKDHYFDLSQEDLNDPGTNICAGIRWLFHKKRLASGKLKKKASWVEAVAEYKSLSKDLKSKNVKKKVDAQKTLNIFKDYYKKYQKCKK